MSPKELCGFEDSCLSLIRYSFLLYQLFLNNIKFKSRMGIGFCLNVCIFECKTKQGEFMKSLLALSLIFSSQTFAGDRTTDKSIQNLASPAQAEYEVNRRNFVSLNSDFPEKVLVVHYPGGSSVTEVCGLQLRTNIAAFSNSHMEEFLKEIKIVDENGMELVSVQRISEPPYISLNRVDSMLVRYKVSTKSGNSLSSEIRSAAEKAKLKFDREPEIMVIAKHCKDQS